MSNDKGSLLDAFYNGTTTERKNKDRESKASQTSRVVTYSLKEELISELVQSSTMRYANYNNNFVNITISYYFNKGRDKTHRRILHNSDTDSGVLK